MLKVTLTACLLLSLANAQSPLTNNDVIHMVSSGISPSLVKATISRSKSDFDLTPSGLILLKKSGLSDEIILAMLSKSNVIRVAQKDTLQTLASGIYYRLKSTLILLEPDYLVRSKTKGVGDVIQKTLVGFIPNIVRTSMGGACAAEKIKERKPTLLFLPANPIQATNELFLVRLIATDSVRRLRVQLPSGGSGLIIIQDSLKIDFTSRRLENGAYEITPDHPLAAGEYGFIYNTASLYTGTRFKIYDFSITGL